MNQIKPKVIVVDDELNILRTIGICFNSIGFHTQLFSKPQEALEAIRQEYFDLAFVDLKMSPIDGLEMLEEVKKISPATTVVIITAHGSIDSAVEAIKKGAYHYLQKPFNFTELQLFAQNTWEFHQLTVEVKELRKLIVPDGKSGSFITRNKKILDILVLAAKIAESNISVLIEGESGTGKELVAHFIHEKSPRSQAPFLKVNCAALPVELLESELFGHVKGAFTGALRDRQGRFEAAEGGSIFLDEIAEMAPTVQVKLLRVLQNKEFERVGESITRKVDVRIIAATNRDLDEALQKGIIRDDLFYRISAVRLKLLPLRERLEDIPVLAFHFLKKYSQHPDIHISPEVMHALRIYPWPGNVRELENVIERASLLAQNKVIELPHLPEEIQHAVASNKQPVTLEEIERAHIEKVLKQSRDFEEAAHILGIDTSTLWRKRKKYGL